MSSDECASWLTEVVHVERLRVAVGPVVVGRASFHFRISRNLQPPHMAIQLGRAKYGGAPLQTEANSAVTPGQGGGDLEGNLTKQLRGSCSTAGSTCQGERLQAFAASVFCVVIKISADFLEDKEGQRRQRGGRRGCHHVKERGQNAGGRQLERKCFRSLAVSGCNQSTSANLGFGVAAA